jgi:uncharacterized protein (DUF885 family)
LRHIGFLFAIGFAACSVTGSAYADAAAELSGLLREYRQAESKLRPATAMQRGDTRYIDQYDEKLAATYFDARRRINEETRTKLAAIDPAGLKPQDTLSYEIFRWSLEDEGRELAPGVSETADLLELNQFNGPQITFPREMQWRSEYPLGRARDYDQNITRMLNFTRWIDQSIATMRQGIRRGIVQPRVIVQRVLAQAEIFANGDPDASVFMGQLKNVPASVPDKEKTRINDAYREAVAGQLVPAYKRLAEFLKTEYLPKARDSIGLSALPGGNEIYLYLVKSETTSDLSPDAIHTLGLSELARIESEMEAVKKQTGFSGSLQNFREFLRNDPRFKFKDQAAMLAEFNRVKSVVDQHLGDVFLTKPKAPLSFRLYDPYVASDRPAAEYSPASGDGRRAGVVYLNASDLPTRPTYTSEVLEIHEGIPGHHLQIAVARENRDLPQFRRVGSETAFTEGWALYAETLGSELGLYTDPYQKFGALSFDAWRASRLVVDTGIHWFGWSYDRAIEFLITHAGLSRGEATEEVNRYIAIPGQALAYKIGEREILSLRERAKAGLGAKFDLKRFHEAILKDGAMPLPVLDVKISRWIEQQKGD